MKEKGVSLFLIIIVFCSSILVCIPPVKAYVDPGWTLQWQTDLTYLPSVTYHDVTFYDQSIVMPVLCDVTGDGIQDVFLTKGYPADPGYEGSGTNNSGDAWCLNGATGAVIWHYGPVPGIGNHAISCIHDLDGDGAMEMLITGYHLTVALHAQNGSVLWSEYDGAHRHDKPAVVLKSEGIIYVYTCMDSYGAPGGIVKRRGSTGVVVAQATAPIYHPCYGGLAAADIDNDGKIELLLGDRSSGVGLACFSSSDLSLLWDYPSVACSTQTPCILDVDGDGGLDVIVNDQSTGKIFAVDGATHQPVWASEKGSWPWSGDIFMSAIYDVDKDGHLEDINCDEGGPTPMYVYDLTTGSLEAQLYRSDGLGLPFPPIVANVYGTADMDFINQYAYEGVDVWDSTYSLVAVAPTDGFHWTKSCCMTVVDMDNDGYNEIVELCHKDDTGFCTFATVQVIQTTGLAGSPKATAKDFGYTYKRSLVSRYVPYDDPDLITTGRTLTVSVPGGHGNVTKNPDKVYYQAGEIVTLRAIADSGWHFDHWSGDLSGTLNPTSITMDGNKTVVATFSQNHGSLTVTTVGNGSVTKSPNKTSYTSGEVVTLTATANAGWLFDHWSGNLSGSKNPTTITMNSNKAVTATFTQKHYTLTITNVGNGTVTKNPNKTTYVYGEAVTLTAVPSTGWSFTSWSGNLSGSQNTKTITMNGNRAATATFAQKHYTLTITNIGNGTVTKNPNKTTYVYGEVVT
ncbi:MAG TPA: hypothetical protein VMT57_08760, partial [Candidatus Thermoplasmatota archaeon]|nr:hypothetical protein [Candidatus Thermoplasmatota archaeon]